MKRAFILIGPKDPYPGTAVATGLSRIGYKTSFAPENLNEVSAFFTWTLWRDSRRSSYADFFSKRGVPIYCMENGWFPLIGGKKYFQLARREGQGTGINGQGVYPAGNSLRWDSWGIELKPWVDELACKKKAILICPQRGVTPKDPLISHGQEWADSIFKRVRELTDREIWWRPHSGSDRLCIPRTGTPDRLVLSKEEPLEETLKHVWCTVVYSTSVSNASLINGVPVLFDGPKIFADVLCGRVTRESLDTPPRPTNRYEVFSNMSWAQWNEDELAGGEPFKRLGL